MTINERVSDATIDEILSGVIEGVEPTSHEIAMAAEIKQYRAAAELEVSDDELNAALTVHRLKTDGHSQLSDAFRAGYKYARRAAPQVTSVPEPTHEATDWQVEEAIARMEGEADMVLVPRGLLGAAMGAIKHPTHEAGVTIGSLRHYAYKSRRAAMLGDSTLINEGTTAAPAVQAEQPCTLPDDFDFDRFNDVVWLEAVASNPHMHSRTTSTIAMVALELNRKLEQLSGNTEHVSQPYKLRDAVTAIRNSGIAIDAGNIQEERDALNEPTCWCRTCRPITVTDMRFVVCPECGNKRCPHANYHRNACTGSNEPGQEGSAYPDAPKQEAE